MLCVLQLPEADARLDDVEDEWPVGAPAAGSPEDCADEALLILSWEMDLVEEQKAPIFPVG